MLTLKETASVADLTYTRLNTDAPLSALKGLERGQGSAVLREHWPFTAQQFTWLTQIPADLPQSPGAGARIGQGETLIAYMPGRILRIAADLTQMDGALSVDLTQGRTLLSLEAKAWRWTLMKGCGLDFETMKTGDCATTSLFKIGVTLWVSGQDEVRILVSYAYARALAEKLRDAAFEGGMEIVVA